MASPFAFIDLPSHEPVPKCFTHNSLWRFNIWTGYFLLILSFSSGVSWCIFQSESFLSAHFQRWPFSSQEKRKGKCAPVTSFSETEARTCQSIGEGWWPQLKLSLRRVTGKCAAVGRRVTAGSEHTTGCFTHKVLYNSDSLPGICGLPWKYSSSLGNSLGSMCLMGLPLANQHSSSFWSQWSGPISTLLPSGHSGPVQSDWWAWEFSRIYKKRTASCPPPDSHPWPIQSLGRVWNLSYCAVQGPSLKWLQEPGGERWESGWSLSPDSNS